MAQIIPLLGGDSTIPLLGGVRGGSLSAFPVFTRTSFTRTRVVKSHRILHESACAWSVYVRRTGRHADRLTTYPSLIPSQEGISNSRFWIIYYPARLVKNFTNKCQYKMIKSCQLETITHTKKNVKIQFLMFSA